MIYGGFFSMVATHFFIGVAIGGVLYYYARWCNRDRPLQFGGDVVSWGLPSRWIFWMLVCLLYEVISSCKAPDMYREVAWSPIEAPAMAFGVFVVDRICRWKELENHINEHLVSRTRKADTSSKDEAKSRFDDLTRGK